MDRFLEKSRSRSRSLTQAAAVAHSAHTQPEGKMAPSVTAQDDTAAQPNTTPPNEPSTQAGTGNYAQIAAAAAQMQQPMIKETVEAAIKTGLSQMRAELQTHTQRMDEAEQRISQNEHDIQGTQTQIDNIDHNMQLLLDKIDDLENRSKRNNLRIVGLPETYKPRDLLHLCAHDIPKALGIKKNCEVERAHRLGTPQTDRRNPRQVIVKYLNYLDKAINCKNLECSRSL